MGELAAPVVVLRVTVRAPDLDAFITRYSRHLAGDRIFIFSKAPQPVGTAVRFNLQLSTGEVLIQGKGTVKRVQADVGDARHPPGMEVQFTPLDERSATLVDFMMATRAGLTEAVATASAPPLVRAVVPPKPKPATPVPKLPKKAEAAKVETPPPLPPAPIVKSKPIPVARPPSLSLESVWKSEASDEATAVSPLPGAEPSQPIATSPPSQPLATSPASMPLLSAQDSSPSLLSLATLSSLPSGAAAAPPPADSPITTLPDAAAPANGEAPTVPPSSADLATIVPPTADPSVNAPPVFAESWGGDAPANPFSDVSDGAIEYFVEWSLEQSIGPRALPQAQFSDVPMALPGESGTFDVFDPPTRRQRMIQLGVVFAAGLLVGGVVVALFKRAPVAPPAPIAAVAEPPAAEPPAKPAPAEADAELAVTTRPAGASVSIDGTAAGTTPLTTHLSPGKHEIVVTKERYTAVTTSTDAPGTLTLDLRRPTATLRVTSTPPAADVVIAGEHRGKTPVDVKLPGFESYDVRVGKAWRKKIYLGHSQNHVEAALAATPRAGRR